MFTRTLALPQNQTRKLLFALSLLLIAGMMLAAGTLMAAAQSSPAAGAGIKKETLGQEMSAVAPGHVLLLARRTFAPGADSGAHPAPGPVVLYVESGDVTFKVVQGEAMVKHHGSTATEMVKAGSEATLATGDEVSYDQGVVHDVYNEGKSPAVTLESRFNPTTPAATANPKS